MLSPSVVRAECPAVLTETQALGSPAHTAQILINNSNVDCPAIKKVSAVLFSGEEIVSSKAFYDDAILNPPLQYPIVDALELPNVAGLYRIEWTAEFLRGEPQTLTQQFIVPCGAPAPAKATWSDAESTLVLSAPPGDSCEGRSTAVLSLADASGQFKLENQTVEYQTSSGEAQIVELKVGELEGERRYVGSLVLSNATGLETVVPVEFVTGCGDIEANVSIIRDRMVGGVKASVCQFPITLSIAVNHSSGETIQTVEAVLKDTTFDFALPEFQSWPAGEYDIETQVIGSVGRTRVNSPVSIACTDPSFTKAVLELDASGNSADVVFNLRNRNICQKETLVTLQVRDSSKVVVFNRTMDVAASSIDQSFRWPFFGIPGNAYEIELGAHYGLNQTSVIKQTDRANYDCTPPKILHLGYSSPDASHAVALVALTSCNAPASAKLVLRNSAGRVVVEGDPQLIQDVGTAYARVAPISLGHLDSGDYEATLVVADNLGRTDTMQVNLSRDVDGPEITFNKSGEQLLESDLPTLTSLDELTLSFSDSNAPMNSFQSYPDTPPAYDGNSTATINRIDGETTSQMWLTGFVDFPRRDTSWGFNGVLVRGQDGQQWIAPIARTYIPSERAELASYHPSRSRIGFRAVARVEPLSMGRYEVLGVVVVEVDGTPRLLPGAGTFNVSALSSQQHDAMLRQGVTELPIALSWSSQNTATLERITSVPDGDYNLSVLGRDVFGNTSKVYSLTLRLNQKKQHATLEWPAIAGYQQSFQHPFRATPIKDPLRLLYRRVDGYGQIRINGRSITEQTSEDILTPDASGQFTITVELIDSDVQGRFVLHADATDASPLELTVNSFRPEFATQRLRTQTTDVLSITYNKQRCRHIVFDDLGDVSLRHNEVLCAVRISAPGTSVVSANDQKTEVRLPQGIKTDALYEEGFIRVTEGMPTFKATRQVPIAEIQAYSSTPQMEFVPLARFRNRAVQGHYVSEKGETVAGHFVVRAALGTPSITVDNIPVQLAPNASGSIRIPVRTSIDALGGKQLVRVVAYYPATPDLKSSSDLEFVAIPDVLFVEAASGEFVTPGPTKMSMRLLSGDGTYQPLLHGAYSLGEVSVVSRKRPDEILPDPTATMDERGAITVDFGSLQPGQYRLNLALLSTDPRFEAHLAALRTDTMFEVLDGSEVSARLFTFRDTDKIPFFGQISVDYDKDVRRRDISMVAWEVSADGKSFKALQCCGHSVDFALTEPGSSYFRAELTNRHSGATSYTKPLKVNAFLSGKLVVEGPRQTFRGFPAAYSVKDLPDGYDVLWRVTTPNGSEPMEYRSHTLSISAEETGTYFIEVVADTATDNPDSVAALRTFFTLECAWPRLPESVISGPTKVEYGKVSTFTVSHPPIFEKQGNPTIKRVGEWELPDGSRVKDDEWTQYTLRSLPEGFTAVEILYHTWLEGDQTTLTTAVHRIEPVSYRWPNWKLKVATNSLEPPAILRLSVAPEEWEEWMELGDSPITTYWDLPHYVRMLDRTPTEAIVYAMDDREFDVVARITDPRGNVTELERTGIRPLMQVPFEISLRAVAMRTLLTAPLDITAHVEAIVLPKGRQINRVAFYLDGLFRGVSDGAPIELQIRTAGEHQLRAIASIDNEFTADDVITLNIGENHKATCTITPVGDFRRNGLAKAECDDPDGHMVEYRWYADGQILSDSGTRVQLTTSGRQSVRELSLVGVDNAGIETTARFVPTPN